MTCQCQLHEHCMECDPKFFAGSSDTHTPNLLPEDELLRIREGVTNALQSRPDNAILLDMARLLNHIEATARVPDLVGDVRAFLTKFGQNYDGPPRLLDGELLDFRIRHMREEVEEYVSWAKPDDAPPEMWAKINAEVARHPGVPFARIAMANQLDACVDEVYVTLQTALRQGFDFYLAWERVHVANMQKEAHPAGKGGIRKPPGWVAPELIDLV